MLKEGIKIIREVAGYFGDTTATGTNVSARIPIEQQIPYRGKKVEPTQDVMYACSFDMRFIFVMVRLEGTAKYSGILLRVHD